MKMTDTLIALVENGPLWDGDIPSKTEREDLILNGLAVRVVVKGEDGHTAATYKGRDLYNKYYGGTTVAESKTMRQANRVVNRAKP